MAYARCGRSGLRLPRLSLGLWQNFGSTASFENAREMVLRSFDHGITHFDLANNYGPPPGSAEENFGRMLRDGSRGASRRADHFHQGRLPDVARPVRRVGLAQVPAGEPGSEPARAWASTTSTSSIRTATTPRRRSRRRWARWTRPCAAGGAVRRHLVVRPGEDGEAAAILRDLRTPCVIHQPSYSMFNRWVEDGPARRAGERGHRLHRVLAAGAGAC